MERKRLYRTEGPDRMIGGVCGGVAEYFDLDPTLVRIGWAIFTLMGGSGFLAYLVCLVIMPKKSDIYPGF